MAAVAPRTWELSVFLADVLGLTDVAAYFPHRVTYHPSCHSMRMLRVGDAPLRLLRAVRGQVQAAHPPRTPSGTMTAFTGVDRGYRVDPVPPRVPDQPRRPDPPRS